MELAQDFHNLFVGIQDRYGQFKGYGEPKPDGKLTKLTTVKKTTPPIERHLKGNGGQIGAFPFTTNDKVKWGCIDVDVYDNPKLHQELLEKLQKHKLHKAVLTKSTSNGGHIWLFFEKPVIAKQLRIRLRALAEALDLGKVEIFPKQDKINHPDFIGNFVYLPYYGGLDNHCIDDKGKHLTIEEFLELTEKNKFSSIKEIKVPRAVKIQQEAEELSTEEYLDEESDLKEILEDGPPCLLEISERKSKEKDNRNNTIFGFAMLSKKVKGKAMLADLKAANKEYCSPALEEEEVKNILHSVNKQNYKMTKLCNKEPMCELCNEDLCSMKKYGVGENVSEYENWLYVADTGKFVRLKPSRKIMSKVDATTTMFSRTGNPKAMNVFMKELARDKQVDDSEWHPGKDLITEIKGVDGSTKKIFNGFMPTTLEAIEGSVAPFLDFMEGRFGSAPDILEFFIDRLAWVVQYPGKKCNISIITYSKEQGTGKSIFGVIMGKIVGRHNYSNVMMDDFLSGWGDTVMNKLWVDVEEAHSQGTDRKKLLSILNRYSTVHIATLNKKYGEFKQVDLLSTLYLTTNFDTAMTITDEDRRFLIWRLDNDKPELKKANYDEGVVFSDWLENDQGYEKIFHFLQQRDVSKFEPYGLAPKTKFKEEMIKATYSPNIVKILNAFPDKKFPLTTESSILCPDHLADIFDVKPETLLDALKKHFKIEKLCRVQNVSFVIPPERSNNDKYQRVDGGARDIHLWTWDKDLLRQKDNTKPSEYLGQYLHPVKVGTLRTFAVGEIDKKKK